MQLAIQRSEVLATRGRKPFPAIVRVGMQPSTKVKIFIGVLLLIVVASGLTFGYGVMKLGQKAMS